MSAQHSRVFVSLMVVLLIGLISGCGMSLFTPQPDAVPTGTARVAVVSVIPWQEIRDKLSPKFNLPNGDAALAKVAPIVQSQDDVFARTLNFIAAAGVAKSVGEAKVAGVDSPNSAFSLPGADGGVALAGVSPMTQYALAAALYQEVQLLNEAVSVFEASDREVFLVATDVALLPRRAAEFDAEVVVSFLPRLQSEVTPDGGTGAADAGPLAHCFESSRDGGVAVMPDSEGTGIEVIPIISQDDLELSQHARAVQDAVQLAFALSAMGTVKQTPAELLSTLGFSREELRRVLGRDINSLQVVGRASRESIIARFGAALTVEPSHTLFPQTRHIYSLLIVPRSMLPYFWKRGGDSLYAISSVRFLDETGTSISGAGTYDGERLNQLLDETGDACRKAVVGNFVRIWNLYQGGQSLLPALSCICGQDMSDYIPSLRHELAAATASGLAGWSPIFLPPPVQDGLLQRNQQPLKLLGTAKSGSGTVTLEVLGRNLSDDRSRWLVTPSVAVGDFQLIPQEVKRVSSQFVQLTVPREPICPDPPDGGSPANACVGTVLYRPHPRIGDDGRWCPTPAPGARDCVETESPYYGQNWSDTADFIIGKVSVSETKPSPQLRVVNGPIASEANGTAVAIVEFRPAPPLDSDTAMVLRLSGGSAVFVENNAPSSEFRLVVPKKAEVYQVAVPLRSLVPGQTISFEICKPGVANAEAKVPAPIGVVARENPGEYNRGTE